MAETAMLRTGTETKHGLSIIGSNKRPHNCRISTSRPISQIKNKKNPKLNSGLTSLGYVIGPDSRDAQHKAS
jgi:hypothetical protein